MSTLPFKVKAVYEYTSAHDDDLNFSNGQIITVTEEEDADWYYGEYVDGSGEKQEGLFPKNFVEKYEPAPPPRPIRTGRQKKEPEVSVPILGNATSTEPELFQSPVTKEEPEEYPKSVSSTGSSAKQANAEVVSSSPKSTEATQ